MKQPKDYENSKYLNHVCKFNKAIYGLKQVPQSWYTRLAENLVYIGFTNYLAYFSLFVFNDCGNIIWILVYVDDLIITDNNDMTIEKVI